MIKLTGSGRIVGFCGLTVSLKRLPIHCVSANRSVQNAAKCAPASRAPGHLQPSLSRPTHIDN
jgi:hypothetical protein